MSVRYTPIQWNQNKLFYDLVLAGLAAAFVLIFLRVGPMFDPPGAPRPDGAIVRARAFGACAFLMLSIVLAIGPLARLDRRFLPLLYNRRHFGVLTCLVALTHAAFVLNWYFAFSPTPKLEALISANTSYGQVVGFPFETLGIVALLILAALAATSHDFWLSFLGPKTWKRLHMLLYPAYALVVAHVALGAAATQAQGGSLGLAAMTLGAAVGVAGLHAAAALREGRAAREARAAAAEPGWRVVGAPTDIPEGRARIISLSADERIAVFRHEGHVAAISNACAHQNGPLGEGRVIDGCVTCPWHGFQYRLEDGCAPAPFTEKLPTYPLRLMGGVVEVRERANPPGEATPPLPIPAALMPEPS